MVRRLDEHDCQLSAACVLVRGLGGPVRPPPRRDKDKSVGSGDANFQADEYGGAGRRRRTVSAPVVPVESKYHRFPAVSGASGHPYFHYSTWYRSHIFALMPVCYHGNGRVPCSRRSVIISTRMIFFFLYFETPLLIKALY